ncbi:hypothetical protein MA20_32110 [Bradyrhizobium japonicum]|uniref:Uncharacterized protein n=1 Tax=Bradyrhizobium japonicum TaxID=375 RepID=A0A0A3XRB5_BRAJP|nr:hypothetical protein [Bradyrhizobium japonicum]KGT75834.1 hypothetical protein MA20_32110 [Bradyrhizobium japonicum]
MQIARKPARHAETAKTVRFVSEREIAAVMAALEDPFGTAERCEFSADGQHRAIGSCGDVVCCHCARIFWN